MLTLIMGPMKSGKSHELIALIAPFKYANKKTVLVQSSRNVRDSSVSSRNGVSAPSIKVKSLSEVGEFDVIGVDEIHMFGTSDAGIIRKWLDMDKEIVLSGIDTDHQGKLMPIFIELMSLKPDKIISKMAVCDVCNEYKAKYTQVLKKGKPVSKKLPAVIPDDGEYEYESRCRSCFIS